MLTGIHFLLTLTCNFECDHCFLYSGPRTGGTFTIDQVRAILDEAVRIGTIEMVFFEGGEPFLYYPLVLAGIDLARQRGFASSVVTNGYWATSEEDAALWLAPLAERGVAAISISDDWFHYGQASGAHAERVVAAAGKLGMTAKNLCTEQPTVEPAPTGSPEGRQVVLSGGVMFRGRAVAKLSTGLPIRNWEELTRCPHEDLAEPRRVHVDSSGHVHLCQGLSMGSCWQTPLCDMVRNYDPQAHPIVGPLLRGGPAMLARQYNLACAPGYVDECHLCFQARLALIGRFSRYLGPPEVYGLTPAKET